jgi:cobaltochelatase CobS
MSSKIENSLIKIDCKKTFGINCNFEVSGFKTPSDLVPNLDKNYLFDEKTSKAILAGFAYNQRVLIQGMHGTGKSTHIEQIASRLNWPCMRINFDSQITRLDLVGKDTIKLKNDKQITEFKEGIIPFALRNGVALVLDEYDAIKTDVSFVIQRLLEEDGKFALLEENEIITPHPNYIRPEKSKKIPLQMSKSPPQFINVIDSRIYKTATTAVTNETPAVITGCASDKGTILRV